MAATKSQADAGRRFKTASPPVICLFLIVATLAVYWPVFHCDFVALDDPEYFITNGNVQTGLNPANIEWAFTTGYVSNWHPLTWISLMLDVQLFGRGPFGPHLVNLLLHVADTGLLFFLLRKLTGATWKSALVAALFALHPLHVESVAWVAERKDVLSAFFGFLSVWAYARYARERSSPSRPRFSVPDYAAALVWLALSLMSKPMLVTLPFVLLLLDFCPLQRFKVSAGKSVFAKLVLEKVPFLVLSFLSSVVTFVVQQKGGAVQGLDHISLSERIQNAFVSYARYLGKTFWPENLANPYPHPGHWPQSLVIFSIGLFILSCLVALLLARKFPFVFVGWFWFAGTLIPTIGLVQVGGAAMADRYMYVPVIGIFIIGAWALGEICTRWRGTQPAVITLAALLVILCAGRTRFQLGCWHDTGTLYTRAVAVTKGDGAASNEMGAWLAAHGQPGLALTAFAEAYRIDPDNFAGLYNMGNALAKTGHKEEAITFYQHAAEIGPINADLLSNLGFALASVKRYDEAVTNFEMALVLKPGSVGAHNNLATILYKEHRFPEAAQHFQEALHFFPANLDVNEVAVKAQICCNLGDALLQQGKTSEAIQSYQQGLQLEPDNPKIRSKLQALGAP
ncbi:MAG TPA: tetratricopeptide repeat protein [Verrucomicrobiae bacterium]|nr:tetratricopeptide repeat protein [Verrucomicrobiae bacterium]